MPQNGDLEFVSLYYDPIKLKNGEDYFTLVERLCSHWSWKITCLSSRTCSSPTKNYSSGKLMSWTWRKSVDEHCHQAFIDTPVKTLNQPRIFSITSANELYDQVWKGCQLERITILLVSVHGSHGLEAKGGKWCNISQDVYKRQSAL